MRRSRRATSSRCGAATHRPRTQATTRGRSGRRARGSTPPRHRGRSAISPAEAETISRNAPPSSICIPALTSGRRGSGAPRRVERPRCPPGPRDEEGDRTADRDPARSGRPGEQRNAAEAEGEPGDRQPRQPLAAGDAVEEGHPERDRSDEQRRDAGVDPRLGPGHATVTDDEERDSEDSRCEPLLPSRPVAARGHPSAQPTRRAVRRRRGIGSTPSGRLAASARRSR